jgi:hypothetical protein
MSAVDFTQPGWITKHGQAVWIMPDKNVEIAGTLLVGVRGSDETFVQFTKGPVVLASARSDEQGWHLDVPARNKTYAYRGKPPTRIIWFQLADALRDGTTRKQWTWIVEDAGVWVLENSRSAERLEGVFAP